MAPEHGCTGKGSDAEHAADTAGSHQTCAKGTEEDIRMISNNNPASEKLLFLVSTLTGREESEPLVTGQKRMDREWKWHSFQAKIKFLGHFVSPLIHLKV